ncbi:MAG: S8 family serine peptidase [Polyangiaceae bacterium]|nr:S8 family serine peptidase [Polyangiaceae bacterium]
MIRSGVLQITLREESATTRIPARPDCLLGAGRQSNAIDRGDVDRTLRRWGASFRTSLVFAARRSLGHIGSQHIGYDDTERSLGMSRTYRVELGDVARARDALSAVRDLAAVAQARIESLATTHDPARSHPSTDTRVDAAMNAHDLIRATPALAREQGDERIVVAVVDTGVALGHPELRRKLLAGYDTVDLGLGKVGGMELVGDSRGADFTPRDDVGHGSHVAGVVAAQGFRLSPGMAGRSLCLPVRVLAAARPSGSRRTIGVGALSDIDCGIKVACDLGAKVINMSFGTSEAHIDAGAPPPHREVVDYAVARGVVLVAAMGNSGQAEKLFPAAIDPVIAVAAVDERFEVSSFSTRGKHVTLAAPGERILSLDRHGYRLSTGTSHAAPFVAGVAALLCARARRRGVELGTREVRDILVRSAQARPADGHRDDIGHGVLDADAALRTLDADLSASPHGRTHTHG